MDWILTPWITLLAAGWLMALGFHAACLVPERPKVRRPRA
jgi:hypothetical protein